MLSEICSPEPMQIGYMVTGAKHSEQKYLCRVFARFRLFFYLFGSYWV